MKATEDHVKPGYAAMLEAVEDPLAPVTAGDEAQPDLLGNRPRPGRPKGSRNKRTEQLLEAVAARGGKSPLEILLDVANGAVTDAKGNVVPVAMDERIRAAVAALPYCHKKLPVEVNTNGVPAMFILGRLERDELEEAMAVQEDGTMTIDVPYEAMDENGGNPPFSGDETSEVGREELDADD